MSNKRFSFGNFSFVPTDTPKRIGSKRGQQRLGRIDEYGPARKITLYVGQNKGQEPRNRTGSCARRPTKFSTAEIDSAFFKARAAQVGKPSVAGTRQSGRGWYEGDPEASVSYEISYIPPEGGGPASEPTFKVFNEHINRLAERLAEDFCQDSVLIVRDDGSKREVASAVWEDED